MASKSRKYWKALKCPMCGENAVFFLTLDAVKGATQYPVPFEVNHKDHKFVIYLDSGLLISRIDEPKEPLTPKKPKPKSKKTKKGA